MIKILCLSLILFSIFGGAAFGHEHWNSESSQDWLGVGMIYSYGSYYYPVYNDAIYYWDWNGYPYYINWEDYPYYWEGNPIYHPSYYPVYSAYNYPRYYDDFNSFPLGTFGMRHGGNY